MTSIIRVSAGVLTRGRRLLICQRRPTDPHPLKWEFPGGKALDGEDEAECLRRGRREECGVGGRRPWAWDYTAPHTPTRTAGPWRSLSFTSWRIAARYRIRSSGP